MYVEDAKVKFKFSKADINEYTVHTQDCAVVEIPIDKFEFDRDTKEFVGNVSVTVEKSVIIIVQDESIFRSFVGAKKFRKQTGRQKL